MERGKKGGAREKEREKIHLLVAKEIGHSVSKSSGPEGNGGKKTDSGTRTDCHWLPQTSLPARNRQQRLWMLVRGSDSRGWAAGAFCSREAKCAFSGSEFRI